MTSSSQFFLIVFCCFLVQNLLIISPIHAQCSGTPIAAFPYEETFESGPGGWFDGGTSSDWAWGNPSKPVINMAGTGTKCWVVGGLSGSFYNLGQRSWVESPCFNFTNLSHPYVKLKVWWESERQYDGANLQYTLDDGQTWTNVGSANDPVDCLNKNWYNYSPITNLNGLANPRHGWSGNLQPTSGSCVGGGGSGTWVIASKCMPYLAGVPSVRFRIVFGAGTTCNDYDGFAFDDFSLSEAPPIQPAFNALCGNTPFTFNFKDLSENCPDTWLWNFGDPASGANNTSTLKNPSHTYSAPGLYTVTLQASSLCSGMFSITGTVRVLGLTATATAASCAGLSNGSATVAVIPAGSNPILTWSTTPAQSGLSVNNLAAGNYTVTVSAFGACPATTTVTITEPPAINATLQSLVAAKCGGSNGSISALVNGGTGAYQYTWAPQGPNAPTLNNIPAGTYGLTVTDANGCKDTLSVPLNGSPAASVAISSVVPVSCFGLSNGSLQTSVLNGTAPFQFQWSVPNAAGPVLNNVPSGLYTVTVTDANGCTDSAPALVNSPNPLILNAQSQPADCGGANGSASVSVNGGTGPYTYQWSGAGGASPILANVTAGLYFVTVTDQQLCTATAVAQVGSISTLQAAIAGSSPVRCAGGNDGTATVAVTGGTGPFTYTWFPQGGNAATASGLSAGTYSVQVLDINQCIASALVTISEAPPSIHNISTTPANCNATDGSAAISSSGGTGAFSYLWPSGIIPQALASGNYMVTITDQNQCKDTILVTVPALPPVELTLTGTKDPSCNGGNDGEIQFVVTGGVEPFQYIFSGTGASGATLAAGNHTIIVFDNNGCRDTITAILNDPPPVTFEVEIQSIACFGTDNGVLEVNNPQNGLPPYQYALNQGAFGADNQFDQLAAGVYEITVMDAAGCTVSDTALIATAPQNSIDAGPDLAVPLGTPVTLAAQASVPFLISSYQWQPDLPGGCTSCPETSFTPVQSGTYTIVATDQNGCVWTDALQIRVLPGQVYVPNVFNPDAPAPNNRFWLNEGGAVDQVEYLRIYDRWGSLVFETEQRAPDAQGSGWNGTVRGQDAPTAVYTWVMRLRWRNGQTEELQGDVTLMR